MSVNYYLYGFKVISAIKLINIPIYSDQCHNGIIYLDFIKKYSSCSTWDISLEKKDSNYILSLGDYITYYIFPREGKITAYASDAALIESTLLNLPFAVFAMSRNSLLLHTSVLTYKDKLIPIFAPKKTGKTTLAAALSQTFPFFSDDTLYAYLEGGDIITYAGLRTLKLHSDSANTLSLSRTSNVLNIQNKGFFLPRNYGTYESLRTENYQLCALFFLSRQNQEQINVEEILSSHLKSMYLHANICGAETLGFDYCEYIKLNDLFKKIISELKFYKLIIPDSLDRLSSVADEFADIIKQLL